MKIITMILLLASFTFASFDVPKCGEREAIPTGDLCDGFQRATDTLNSIKWTPSTEKQLKALWNFENILISDQEKIKIHGVKSKILATTWWDKIDYRITFKAKFTTKDKFFVLLIHELRHVWQIKSERESLAGNNNYAREFDALMFGLDVQCEMPKENRLYVQLKCKDGESRESQIKRVDKYIAKHYVFDGEGDGDLKLLN